MQFPQIFYFLKKKEKKIRTISNSIEIKKSLQLNIKNEGKLEKFCLCPDWGEARRTSMASELLMLLLFHLWWLKIQICWSLWASWLPLQHATVCRPFCNVQCDEMENYISKWIFSLEAALIHPASLLALALKILNFALPLLQVNIFSKWSDDYSVFGFRRRANTTAGLAKKNKKKTQRVVISQRFHNS